MLRLNWYCVPLTTARDEQSRIARRMLAHLLEEHRLSPAPICTDNAGRPFLEGMPHADFNITHTTGLVAVALSLAPKGEIAPRVGIDAESEREIDPERAKRLAERFFAPCELAFFRAQGESVHAFATVFTRKEAFAKCRGDGLAAHLRATDTLAPGFEDNERVRFILPSDTPLGYCVTLCTEQ